MNKRIKAHVDALFANTSTDSYVLDIKEELLANLNEKYDDLISSDKSEEEAYALVISGIGDIDNLLKDIGQSSQYQPLEIEKNIQKRGILISIGIALYILSIIPIIFLDQLGFSSFGVIFMFFFCAVATGFIAYGYSISKVNYSKEDNSFVEEYKEKVAINNDRKKLMGAISSSLWSLIVVLYLLISFLTSWWHISWIIFLIGACIQQLILYRFADSKKRKRLWHGILWTLAVIIYFIISFGFWAWTWTWMIFLLALAAEQIIRLIILWKKAA